MVTGGQEEIKWEEKLSGVTFMHESRGSHQREMCVDIEEETAPGEPDHEDLMLEQVIKFLRETFDNFKEHKALT